MRSFLVALTFLTRVPISIRAVNEKDLGRSVAFFPAVGLFLGLAAASIDALARDRFSAELRALFLLLVTVAATGALHLDGVADVFDGMGGGRGDRARTLAIMRDSHIGAFGVVAVVLALLAKCFALFEITRRNLLWAVWLAPTIARALVTPLIAFFPYARAEGLGRAFAGYARLPQVLVALTLAAIPLALTAIQGISAWTLLTAVVAAFAAAFALARWIASRLGGLTGDAYGAAIECAEITFLIVAGSV